MTTEQIKEAILGLIDEYHISKVILFGSRANGTNRENSEILKLDVDVIHGPIREEDMIEVKDEVVLYAA